MKRYFHILIFIFCPLMLFGQSTPSWQWASADVAPCSVLWSRNTMAVDSHGNTYICGGTQDSSAGQGWCDAFLAKYDAAGEIVWYKTAGGNFIDQFTAVAIDPWGNVFTTGYMGWNTNGFLTDTVYFGTTAFETNSPDAFLAKYDKDGNLVWVKKYGGSLEDIAIGIKADSQGQLYFTGHYAVGSYPNPGTADFDGTILTSYKGGDAFLAKCDSGGTLQWIQSIGSSDEGDLGFSIGIDSEQSVFIAGQFTGPKLFFDSYTLNSASSGFVGAELFVAKYDSAGNFIWAKTGAPVNSSSSTGGEIEISMLSIGPSGSVYVSGGYINCSINFDGYVLPNSTGTTKQVFVAKYNNSGDFLWAKEFGSDADDAGGNIASDELNRIYITGFYTDDIYFGGDTLQHHGFRDIFIACLDSNGMHQWSTSVANSSIYEDAFSIAVRDGGTSLYLSGLASGDTVTQFGNITVPFNGYGGHFVARASIITDVPQVTGSSSLSVYPNPVHDVVYLSGLQGEAVVSIYELSGRVAYEGVTDFSANNAQIELPEMAPGMYILQVISKHGSTTKKIIKQ